MRDCRSFRRIADPVRVPGRAQMLSHANSFSALLWNHLSGRFCGGRVTDPDPFPGPDPHSPSDISSNPETSNHTRLRHEASSAHLSGPVIISAHVHCKLLSILVYVRSPSLVQGPDRKDLKCLPLTASPASVKVASEPFTVGDLPTSVGHI
jgi:hypothetical protein